MEDPRDVSIQNSPHLRRLSDYLSRSTISDAYTAARGPLDLTADPATLPNIEMRKLSSYFQAGPRGGAPSKKGPATVHKVKGANSRIIKPAKAVGLSPAGRKQVAQETIAHIPTILRSADAGSRLGYKVTKDNVGPLNSKMEECQGLSTRVMVVQGDTYDVAIALHNARDLMDHADPMPVCVLNFANAETIGGAWLRGAPAQEEQLCYRSTLSETLLPRLYPMGDKECIYSPHVIIFRENEKRGYSYMWSNKRDPLPQVSVISMAAQRHPPTTEANKYLNDTDRKLMKDKMRMILRTAGHNRHQRLVLGALGCGMFGHPAQEVADCWKEVLDEVEFQGFFDLIVFAIYDAGNEGNYEIFHATLHEDVETDYESIE
ncbi:hypothetical protein N7467_004912 [Penicillium canescens]|nr:hypothetical protein N7467_004912 [Penicillium canescens]